MKKSFIRVLCALCVFALLPVPVAALAEGEQAPTQLNISSDRKARFAVPNSGLDTDDMYLNGIPYEPQLNQRNDLIVRTGDLLAAKVIGEIPNVDPGAFQISGGKISFKISVTVPDEGEAAPPAATATETNPLALFQYVEDRTSDERLAYPEAVIQKYTQALIDGIAKLIEDLESEDGLTEYRNSDGSLSGNPSQEADIPALLTYVTSMLSGDPVTAEAFDNAMYAIYSKLCVLDDVAGHTVHPNQSGNKVRALTNRSPLMYTFRTVMNKSGMNLPGYLINSWSNENEATRGPWREGDYGKLDELATVQKKLKEANGFQLKGVTFELSDGAGNVLPLSVASVSRPPAVDPAPPAPDPIPSLVIESEGLRDNGTATIPVDLMQGYFLQVTETSRPAGAALYLWDATGLPDGLGIAADSEHPVTANISGTPTVVTGPDGTFVVVNVRTTVDSQVYTGSMSFTMIVDDLAGGGSPLSFGPSLPMALEDPAEPEPEPEPGT